MTNKLPEMEYLADLVGEFIEYWGFKKIHGKIWTHLYLSEVPLDASALIQKLEVSKALISISLKDLLDFHVIIESGLSAEGTRLYVANPDIQKVITNVIRQREKIMMGKIQAAFNHVKKLSKEEVTTHQLNTNRMKDLDKFIKNGEKGLDAIITLL